VPYYPLVTFSRPECISWILRGSYSKLARTDGRNDSQIILYDVVIPGSALIGYLLGLRMVFDWRYYR
jgi:hypothetical protein